MKFRYLVTGCPRSGTKTARLVMEKMGLKVTHEDVFNETGFRPEKAMAKSIEAESSCFAVPFVEQLREDVPDVRVVHLVREPLACIASLIKRTILSGATGKFFLPWIGADPRRRDKLTVDDHACFWCEWNLMLRAAGPDAVARIEDGSEMMAKIINPDFVGSVGVGLIDNQTTGGVEPIRWSDITDRVTRERVRMYAQEYGYTV